jgi:hypothetical protein
VSEVHDRTSAFFDLYQAHGVSEDAIHDFIDDWHNSGEEEMRELWQFLGMTQDEYSVWVMDARALPLLRDARETQETLVLAVARYLDELRARNAPADRAATHALSHWMAHRSSSSGD